MDGRLQRGTAHKGPGLGRQNRAQRLLEYAERRAVVLGQTCTPPIRLAGRKRRRQWDNWPIKPRRLPNATVLDIIYEADEEEADCLSLSAEKAREEAERRLMDVHTMVFGMGVSPADVRIGYVNFLLFFICIRWCSFYVVRYKYVPALLQEVLFPSRSSNVDAPPARKRRRLDHSEDVEMANLPSAGPSPAPDLRPVVLETGKESYLLSPSLLSLPSSSGPCRVYDIALILEAEVVVEEEQPIDAEIVTEKTQDESTPVPGTTPKDDLMIEESKGTNESPKNLASSFEKLQEQPAIQDALSPTNELPPEQLELSTSPVHSPETASGADEGSLQPPSSPLLLAAEKTPAVVAYEELEKPQFALQVLQRNLAQNMFRFADDGVYVLDGSGSGDGMETEWVIQVKNWKWAPRGSKER